MATKSEKASCFTHWAGRASSLEDAAKEAQAKAGVFYARGHDDAAQIWRDVSLWLEELGSNERREQRKFATEEELKILGPAKGV